MCKSLSAITFGSVSESRVVTLTCELRLYTTAPNAHDSLVSGAPNSRSMVAIL